MSKKHFQQGLILYKSGDLQQALEQFNKAIDNDAQDNYKMLDTRAAVYAKLGETKKALQDAKRTIEVAPNQWQGYARAAQLFLTANKPESCLTMIRLGLSKLKEEHAERRASLLSLEAKALEAQEEAERRRRQCFDHMGNLPMELFGEIARIVVEADHTAVIALSQVSKHWRRVIHNCSYLWSTLKLTRRRPKHKAKAWIERSKGILRELSVDNDVANDAGWPDDILHGIRWEGLRILAYHASTVDIKQYLHRIGKSNALHNLESLGIIGLHPHAHMIPVPSTELPSLQHLAIHHVFSFRNPLKLLLGYKNLLSITLGSIRVHEVVEMYEFFEAQPLIERIILHSPSFTVTTAVPLKHLTHLDIKGARSPLIFSDLSALQILRLDAVRMTDELLDIVEKSRPNLTELAIRSCAVSVSNVIAVLNTVSPTIQILEVTNTRAAEIINYLAELQPPPKDAPGSDFSPLVWCPNLTYVDFSKCQDVQAGPIGRMIRARLPPQPPASETRAESQPQVEQITTLVIDECDNMDSSWLPWLRQHVLSVSCVYMSKRTKFRV